MTKQEIENILDKLHNTLMKKEHETYKGEIRVRIGRELLAGICAYNRNLVMNFRGRTEHKILLGHIIEIENANPMCLEVLTVESVPIYRESEV